MGQSLIRPGQPISQAVSSKPLRIDRGDPIMADIWSCVVWNCPGLLLDLARPSAGNLTLTNANDGTKPSWGNSAPLGSGGYMTHGASFTSNAGTAGAATGRGWTVRLVASPVSWPGGFTSIWDAATRSISTFFDTSGAPSFGGVYGATPSGSLVLPVGRLFDLVVTGQANSPFTARFWVNGVLNQSATWSATSGDAALTFARNSSGGGTNGDLIYYIHQEWRRELPAGDIQRLQRNKYAGLYQAGPRWRVGVAAAGGTTRPVKMVGRWGGYAGGSGGFAG